MGIFVIVHGGFGGGWEWTPVARLLRGLGHEVYTPTLSGMGEHSHLASAAPVGLSTHVQDVVGVLEYEDLHNVVLVGSGYGGIPVTSAADRVAHRVSMIAYLDALVPYDGECALDLLPSLFGQFVRESVEEFGETWRVPSLVDPMPQATFESPVEREAHGLRLRAQPAMTFVEPVYLSGAIDHVPRAFVRCTQTDLLDENDVDPVEAMVGRASNGFWHYREMSAPHDPHLTHPQATVRVLTELTVSVLEKLPSTSLQVPTQSRGGADGLGALGTTGADGTLDWVWSPN
jgi:pimeloyl-ACP methyl ester carboxylesterase